MNKHDEIKNAIDKFVEKQTLKHCSHYIMSGLATYVATMSGYTLENEDQIIRLFDTLKLHCLKIFIDKNEREKV